MSGANPEFADLRQRFAQLIEASHSQQQAELASLAASAPALAQRLRRLLAQALTTPAATPTPTLIGTQLGPFLVEQPLALGGMGVVYRGRRVDGAYEQAVALKLIAPGLDSLSLRQRFVRERQILARLQHPHIAALLDGGISAEGQLWLALELVDGIPINVWCESRRCSLVERIKLFLALCSGVRHAHEQLVLHRDLKPANVLVDASGRPRLLDFGIAGLLDTGDQAQATRATAMTVRYAAPEQVRQQFCTTATDVYALGVLLFELLSGQSPYAAAAAGQQSWAEAVLASPPQALPQAAAAVPDYSPGERHALAGELQLIVAHAMAKEPAQRYPTVQALMVDLEDWQAGRAPRSGVGGTRAQLRGFWRRYRWPLSATAAVVGALSLGGVWALHEARLARQQAHLAQANYTALLGVLSSASPSDYVGREATASEFLVEAARVIHLRLAEQPQLVWRSLSEIGNGLLNLGREAPAETVLLLAAEAVRRDPQARADDELEVLKLLGFAQSRREAGIRAQATATRTASLARQPGTTAGATADALASAANLMSRHGQSTLAGSLLQQLETLLAKQPDIPTAMLERIERQRGLAELREGRADVAIASFSRALAAIDRKPRQFSTLRRAELQFFLADAWLAAGQPAAARNGWSAAAPVFRAEYPQAHPERALLDLIEAQLLLAEGQLAQAQALAVDAASRLQGDESGRPRALRLLARLALVQQQCPDAAVTLAQLAGLQAVDNRSRALSNDLERDWQRQCGTGDD